MPEEALSDPELATTLVASVIADLECAWDNYVAGAAIHSDEFIQSSGNLLQRNWGTRWITADDANLAQGSCEGAGYGSYTPLHTARFQAEGVFRRLGEFPDAKVPKKVSMQATVRAYGAFALVALGEGYCEMALDGGPLMTPKDVLKVAESKFSQAIELATRAGNTDILNLWLVGRARVRLDLGDFAGAIADASRVPAGYRKNATRDATDERRYNTHCEWVNCPQWRHASVAPNYRNLEWRGVPDPRVQVRATGRLGFDFVTPHYVHQKATDRSSPVLLASYKEARLFIAEAAARSGDLATARQVINQLHAEAGIPGYDEEGKATQDEVIRQVLEERRRELFAEGGHRLNDHLRFRGTTFNIPFLGEPGSIHPNGVDHSGVPYGPTTCLPLPTVERAGNPNIERD